MAKSATTSIPRFLLPQLTWKPLVPPTFVFTPQIKRIPIAPTALSNPPHRTLTSIAQPWYEHGRRSSPTPCLSTIEKSQLRPSAARQPPNPLSLAFRILSQKPFSTTSYLFRDHHFDTLKLVQRLKDEGFSEDQSKAMMLVLSDVVEESIQNLTRTMVLREDADRSTYTQKVDFTKLRSELLALDSSDTSVTLASHERLSNDIAKLNSRLRDEIGRAQASVRLDLNLEKGRIREEAKGQELKIKETETRIEQEVAGLRERVEGVKFSTLQWLVGVCTGAAALILGAWRLLM
ncbi:MAG: hypothetical protein LQ339_007173 [Xanthoria mediterranea]|nr:MAG: hypothetical protein LQ339_007173 [Xanthoria mediterranea]